eukprot:TRINITY_DN1234_c0_g1_i1.p1 TRINITY_DN1234_c0_g1~~TRINITY_DN1234_c0_g1_i1.p1  ORF type:complete len:124 (+),score=0.96 TRINITY_DN1234_c0_g1_i1:40-411(+)
MHQSDQGNKILRSRRPENSVRPLFRCCLPSQSKSLISLRVFESQDGHPAVSSLIDTQPPFCLQFLLALHCVYYTLLPKPYLLSPHRTLVRHLQSCVFFIVCLSMRASTMKRDTAPVLPLVPPP